MIQENSFQAMQTGVLLLSALASEAQPWTSSPLLLSPYASNFLNNADYCFNSTGGSSYTPRLLRWLPKHKLSPLLSGGKSRHNRLLWKHIPACAAASLEVRFWPSRWLQGCLLWCLLGKWWQVLLWVTLVSIWRNSIGGSTPVLCNSDLRKGLLSFRYAHLWHFNGSFLNKK